GGRGAAIRLQARPPARSIQSPAARSLGARYCPARPSYRQRRPRRLSPDRAWRQPDAAGVDPTRARGTGPALRLPGVHETTQLVRRASPRLVDARWRDGAPQSGGALSVAPPDGPRRGLDAGANEGPSLERQASTPSSPGERPI